MMSTVARPNSPAWAETPIASPSAKLCSPMAAATIIPVRRALRSRDTWAAASAKRSPVPMSSVPGRRRAVRARAAGREASLGSGDPADAGKEPGGEQEQEADDGPE